jgi:hypothetical protein
LSDIFYQGRARNEVILRPLDCTEATAFWRTSESVQAEESLDDDRIVQGSPLEGLFQILRRKASAQASEIASEFTESESDDETVDPTEEEMEVLRGQVTPLKPQPQFKPRHPQAQSQSQSQSQSQPQPDWGRHSLRALQERSNERRNAEVAAEEAEAEVHIEPEQVPEARRNEEEAEAEAEADTEATFELMESVNEIIIVRKLRQKTL